jgi:hypothetical protein
MKLNPSSLLIGALLSVGAAAQTLPQAEEILDRFIEVTGGKAAYRAQTTQVWTGTITIPAQHLNGPEVRYYARSGKLYDVTEMPTVGKIESGVANNHAWMKNTITGPRLKSGDEEEEARRDAHFNLPADWREVYPQTETTGIETVEGEECYRVVLTAPAGPAETQYFSKSTGLRLRTTMSYTSFAGIYSTDELFFDYKPFGGVLFSTRQKVTIGEQAMEVLISDIAVNVPIPPETFDPPADVKALLAPPTKARKK